MQASIGILGDISLQMRDKKTAPFQGRGKSDREEVTVRARETQTRQDETGTAKLTMYFGAMRRPRFRDRRQENLVGLGNGG